MEEQEAHGLYALIKAVAAGKFPCQAMKAQFGRTGDLRGMVKDQEGKAICSTGS